VSSSLHPGALVLRCTEMHSKSPITRAGLRRCGARCCGNVAAAVRPALRLFRARRRGRVLAIQGLRRRTDVAFAVLAPGPMHQHAACAACGRSGKRQEWPKSSSRPGKLFVTSRRSLRHVQALWFSDVLSAL